MARPRSEHPKMKNNLYIRKTFLYKIDELSYDLGISKTNILDLCLEESMPMLDRLLEKIVKVKATTK